jgi:LGFP repeat
VTAPTTRMVSAATAMLDRTVTRRGLFARFALAGSAVTTSGFDYLLHPGSAYASVCGEATTCSSGWTALCCTVNNGVNQCPPGSFAGGWWKAEGASLCGGKARYYVDCQAECTRCGCHGSHFCGEECWNCKPHCAHHGSCDQRRVCRNVFRYGQCERGRHCGGPVWCRVTSCTPPWRWANCSTTSATDEFTVSHSAPCLPQWTAIERRYTDLGSQGSVLGATVHGEIKARQGHIQKYEHGRMYWSEHTGARYLTANVLHRYLAVGQTGSALGLPTTDVHRTTDNRGHGARFQHGGIYQGPGHGAHAMWGAIWDKWLARGLYTGPLGYPVSDRLATAHDTGHYVHFEKGSIYEGAGHGAHDLYGAIAAKYTELRDSTGPLGFPVTDQATVHDADGNPGMEVSFVTGAIDLVDGDPARAVWGPIYTAWTNDGGVGGPLGFPISDVFAVDETDQQCNFVHGQVTYNQTTGAVTITLS